VAGQSYLVRFAAVDGLDSKLDPKTAAETYFVMLRSLDEALKPYYQIRNFLFKLGFFAFAVAILAALVIANTLSRRVSRLASATSLVAGGDLDISVPVGGNDEIGSLGRAFNDMIAKLRISRDELRSKERLERELEIATVIQTLLLPAQPALDGFDVAARMVPAEEVGGDFYDVHQASGGSWVAIGDVSGHGVTPGLIMMMVQSMLSALARQSPEVGQKYTPKEVLRIINSALHDNLRTRMHDDNYMTMVLLKHVGNGKFRYAGAHESLLIYRRATHQVETLSTDGTWLGLQDDIGAFLEEHEIDLAPGDALVLYTDGITEAKNPQGVQYNIDRLRDMLLRQGSMSMPSAQKIRDGIVDDVMTWSRTRQDDVTVMVLRRLES
jgi:sigma-B regulation protein RsbU (phosphoserine phosphatase)